MTTVQPNDQLDVAERPAWLRPEPAPHPGSVSHEHLAVAPPGRPRTSVLLRTGRALTALGLVAALFIGYEFVITGLVHDRDQAALLTTFKQQITTTTLDASGAAVAEGTPVALMTIPRIGLNQVVVEGTSPEDLQAGPGHLRSSPVPGEFGNAVIAGRRTSYSGPFSNLDHLGTGDRITVTTGQGSFVYIVSQVGRAPSGQASPLVGTADSRLTLVTSDPALLPTGRLVVVARLQGPPIAVPTRAATHVAADDLGLSGDPVGLLFALVWATLLGGALWLARRLGGRWPRSVSLMLAIPVVVALAMLTFASLDPVLPGTL